MREEEARWKEGKFVLNWGSLEHVSLLKRQLSAKRIRMCRQLIPLMGRSGLGG